MEDVWRKKALLEKSARLYLRKGEELAQKRLDEKEKIRLRNAKSYEKRKAPKKQKTDALVVQRKKRERNASDYQRRKTAKVKNPGGKLPKERYFELGQLMIGTDGRPCTLSENNEKVRNAKTRARIQELQKKLNGGRELPNICKICKKGYYPQEENLSDSLVCIVCIPKQSKELKKEELQKKKDQKRMELCAKWEEDVFLCERSKGVCKGCEACFPCKGCKSCEPPRSFRDCDSCLKSNRSCKKCGSTTRFESIGAPKSCRSGRVTMTLCEYERENRSKKGKKQNRRQTRLANTAVKSKKQKPGVRSSPAQPVERRTPSTFPLTETTANSSKTNLKSTPTTTKLMRKNGKKHSSKRIRKNARLVTTSTPTTKKKRSSRNLWRST